VGWTVDGREEPFDRRIVFSAPPVRSAVAADRVVGAAAVALDLFLCASAAIALLRIVARACRRLADTPDARDAVTLAWAIGLVDAFLFAVPVLHKMVVLTGGDDPMVYETQWTTLRHVFATPHWQGEAYPAQFHPVLMKGPGEVWFKQLRLVRLTRVN
jgi:hypothetical protein